MAYVLTNKKLRQTSLPVKHGNDVFETVCSWSLRQGFMMEIDASALYAYLRCGNQISNLLPP